MGSSGAGRLLSDGLRELELSGARGRSRERIRHVPSQRYNPLQLHNIQIPQAVLFLSFFGCGLVIM